MAGRGLSGRVDALEAGADPRRAFIVVEPGEPADSARRRWEASNGPVGSAGIVWIETGVPRTGGFLCA